MINPESVDITSLPSVRLDERGQLPTTPCIYFAIANGEVQYIGRSVNPRQRWVGHHRYGQIQAMGDAHIAYLDCPEGLLDEVAMALIEWFDPPLNGDPMCGSSESDARLVKSNLPVLMAMHDPPLTQADVARTAKISPTTINCLYKDTLQRMDKSLFSHLIETYGWTPGDIWIVVPDADD